MKNITRWSLMRNTVTENVAEHSHMVAVIAHALAVIRRDIFGGQADPGAVAAFALFHDASEIFTGDLPTPIKYLTRELTLSYKNVEALAAKKLLSSIPAELRAAYEPLLAGSDCQETRNLTKAADTLSAYMKCLEELKSGNGEFRLAESQSLDKLRLLDMPEVDYFIEHFIPAFSLTLDELDFSVE